MRQPPVKSSEKGSVGNNIKGHLLPLLVFMPALVYSNELRDYALIPRYLLLCLFSLGFTGLLLTRRVWAGECAILRITSVRVLLFIWLIASIVSGLRSDLIGEYLFDVHRFGLYVLFFLALSSALKDIRNTEPLLKMGVVVTLLICGIAVWQFLHHDATVRVAGMSQVTGLMSNKNLLSEFLVLTVPFCAISMFVLPSLWRYIGAIALISGIVCVMTLLGRAAWLGLLIMTSYAGFTHLFLRSKQQSGIEPRRILLAIILPITFLCALFISIDHWSDGHLTRRLISVFDVLKGSENIRLRMWDLTWEMIKESPVLGIGLGDWKIAIQEAGLTASAVKFIARPHNDYVSLMCETGMFGGLAYMGCITVSLVQLVRNGLRHPENRLYMVASASLLAFAVTSFFSFPLERVEHSVIMLFCLAVADSGSRAIEVPMGAFGRGALIFLLAAMSISAFTIGIGRYQGEKHMKVAMEARLRGDWASVLAATDKINVFLYPIEPATTPVKWYSGIAHFQMNRPQMALKDFEAAYAVNPGHIHVLNNLATCHAMNGDLSVAIKLYSKAIVIYPGFADAIANLVAVYLHLGEYDEAMNVIWRSSLKRKDALSDILNELVETASEPNGTEMNEKLSALITSIKKQ